MTGGRKEGDAISLNLKYFRHMFNYHKKARFVTDLIGPQMPGVQFRVDLACLLGGANITRRH
jgi:hypothetical protein